jgi:hypothetical protein
VPHAFGASELRETYPHYTKNSPNFELPNWLIYGHVSSNTNGPDLLRGFGTSKFFIAEHHHTPGLSNVKFMTLSNLQTCVLEYEVSKFSPKFGTLKVFANPRPSVIDDQNFLYSGKIKNSLESADLGPSVIENRTFSLVDIQCFTQFSDPRPSMFFVGKLPHLRIFDKIIGESRSLIS